jgi:hypothetical protein
LDILITRHTPDFAQTCQGAAPEGAQLSRHFKKIGLAIKVGTIQFPDPLQTKWRPVSILARNDIKTPASVEINT